MGLKGVMTGDPGRSEEVAPGGCWGLLYTQSGRSRGRFSEDLPPEKEGVTKRGRARGMQLPPLLAWLVEEVVGCPRVGLYFPHLCIPFSAGVVSRSRYRRYSTPRRLFMH